MGSAATAMEHREAEALFAPMVDRELAPQQEAALRSHLESCHDCQRGFEKYARAVELVRGVARERAPGDFAQQVLKRVRKRRRGLFGSQGARWFEHISVPVEAALPVILAAIVAALVIVLAGD